MLREESGAPEAVGWRTGELSCGGRTGIVQLVSQQTDFLFLSLDLVPNLGRLIKTGRTRADLLSQ